MVSNHPGQSYYTVEPQYGSHSANYVDTSLSFQEFQQKSWRWYLEGTVFTPFTLESGGIIHISINTIHIFLLQHLFPSANKAVDIKGNVFNTTTPIVYSYNTTIILCENKLKNMRTGHVAL